MESSYSAGKDSRQDNKIRQERQQKTPEHRRQSDDPAAAFVHAAQLLQSGARLQDLSPEEAREVASAIGNQSMLNLMHGGGSIPLAAAPPGRSTEEALPETAVDIRWPILCALPGFKRDGPLPGKAFQMDRFRPMGQCTGNGVIPDG